MLMYGWLHITTRLSKGCTLHVTNCVRPNFEALVFVAASFNYLFDLKPSLLQVDFISGIVLDARKGGPLILAGSY